ncbi:MAG TPA: hypothetical protein VKV36_01195 [Acidimicrobiales bacterium]|nr:hypothetical protein [Acidimicrobiales bacterium]HLH46162.1 hypothetical protein [Acidimicrobiales bacterium]
MPTERRYHAQGFPDRCRLCWSTFTPDRGQVEVAERYVYYRCPNCGCSFPIRRGDLALLGDGPFGHPAP